MADDLYTGVASSPAPEVQPSQVGAWRVTGVIGSGATADVFAVEHVRTARQGALKRMRPGTDGHRFRNELLALGVLELPGVVRVIDDGLHAGAPYLVEERIDGEPFPGAPLPATWDALAPRVASLLLALERLHRAGIFHLDLKPANALVDTAGHVTLVDLGLCQGPALGIRPTPEHVAAGTLSTMSPEQRAGGAVDARSDLYAAGRMLSAWLANHAHPRHVRDVVERMCSLGAEGRPPTALAALQELGLDPVERLVEPVAVNGPDRLVHGPTDAAAAFVGRSQREVVREWVCAGDAVVEVDGTVTLTPLGRARLHGRVPADADPAVLDELSRGYDAVGALSVAGRCLASLAARARWHRWDGLDSPVSEASVLARWLSVALRMEDPDAVERVGYAVARVPDAPPDLARVARAAVALVRGRREDALRETVQPLADGCLEAVRHRVRIQAAVSLPEPEQLRVLADADRWAAAGDDEARAQVAGWRAHVDYRAGRYAAAAALHERALDAQFAGPRRVSAALNAASCWMEVGAHERAYALARTARDEAARLRHLVFEVRAEWLLRSIAHRDGRAKDIDEELLDAVALVDMPLWRGLVRLGEASVAWRIRSPRCGDIARLARVDLLAAGQARAALLAEALEAVSGQLSGSIGDLLTRIGDPIGEHDDLTWQLLGVLQVERRLTARDADRALELATCAPDPGRRREILAPVEVLEGIAT